jgi:uncharacterized protein YcbK (DUF882 family)
MIGRRLFLLGATASAAGAALPATKTRASAAVAAPERWIWARNHAGEEVATAYRSGDAYDTQALARLRHLFRDLREEAQGPLPPLLVDILSVLQEQRGYARPLLVGSGYRTLKTNLSLEGAAPASFHLRGWAADISMRGIQPVDLGLAVWTLSQRFGFMGVGLYPGFVHVDVGPRRAWTRFGA